MSAMKFTEDHEWIRINDDGTAVVGITDYAQDQLGELVYVELPEVGTVFSQGAEMCVIESVKAAGEVKAPVGGTVLETNEAHLETAFNYELMVRLRNEIAAGDEVPEFRRPTVPGNQGDNPEEEMEDDVQIYVPRDSFIDPNETEDPTIGEGAPIRKRG